MEPTIWESPNSEFTFIQNDDCNIKLEGKEATIIIKDVRKKAIDWSMLWTGLTIGIIVGFLAAVFIL